MFTHCSHVRLYPSDLWLVCKTWSMTSILFNISCLGNNYVLLLNNICNQNHCSCQGDITQCQQKRKWWFWKVTMIFLKYFLIRFPYHFIFIQINPVAQNLPKESLFSLSSVYIFLFLLCQSAPWACCAWIKCQPCRMLMSPGQAKSCQAGRARLLAGKQEENTLDPKS